MQWMPAAQWEASPLLREPRVLGVVTFGDSSPLAASVQLPQAHLRTPVLDGKGRTVEVWLGRPDALPERIGSVQCRHNGEVMFAAVSVPVAHEGDDAFGEATFAAYCALFDALKQSGYPHLLRVWNSIPGINGDDAGLERYRRFNLQRYRAYQDSNTPTPASAPAACALGSLGGPFVLHCLASRTPAEAIENPRQVSAYRYPQQYGPRAPYFSRAALWRGAESDVLFVSGTASIVGHETMHRGDVVAQTRETLANLSAVLAEAVRHGARGVTTLSDLMLKVYVRDAQSTELIRGVLIEHGLDAGGALFLHADICRAELLMEIEAIGGAGVVNRP